MADQQLHPGNRAVPRGATENVAGEDPAQLLGTAAEFARLGDGEKAFSFLKRAVDIIIEMPESEQKTALLGQLKHPPVGLMESVENYLSAQAQLTWRDELRMSCDALRTAKALYSSLRTLQGGEGEQAATALFLPRFDGLIKRAEAQADYAVSLRSAFDQAVVDASELAKLLKADISGDLNSAQNRMPVMPQAEAAEIPVSAEIREAVRLFSLLSPDEQSGARSKLSGRMHARIDDLSRNAEDARDEYQAFLCTIALLKAEGTAIGIDLAEQLQALEERFPTTEKARIWQSTATFLCEKDLVSCYLPGRGSFSYGGRLPTAKRE